MMMIILDDLVCFVRARRRCPLFCVVVFGLALTLLLNA